MLPSVLDIITWSLANNSVNSCDFFEVDPPTYHKSQT